MAEDCTPATEDAISTDRQMSLLAVDDEADEPLCRICFGPDGFEDSGNPAEQLIKPCKCSGKTRISAIFTVSMH